MKKETFWPSLFSKVTFVATLLFSNSIFSMENDRSEETKRKQVKFNTRIITAFNKNIDLSWLENDDGIPPGRYAVETFMNGKKLGTYQIDFVSSDGGVKPCIPESILDKVIFKDRASLQMKHKKTCINLSEITPGAQVNYDYEDEKLIVTIPQIYLQQQPEGFIEPARWDQGINALSVNYSLSGSHYLYHNQPSQSLVYGNLLTTLRLGAWRFNTYDALKAGSQQSTGIDHMQAYAQRSVGMLLSEFSVGDMNTSGEIFDTTSLRGVILRSDERMLPMTMKGYTPEIRGIANSNAVVTIKQNGNVLYEQTVPPGEFNISNLVALGYGGDLEVTVTEMNGTVRTFSVPYGSIPQLLRKGYFKYAIAAGDVRNYGLAGRPFLLESTLQYGVGNDITLYGGGQTSAGNAYSALISGLAINTTLGAFSVDIAKSFVPENAGKTSGVGGMDNSRFKFNYAKLYSPTGTQLNLVNYYFSGENYYSLNDALQIQGARQRGDQQWQPERYRHRFDATISQQLPDGWGNLSLSGWWERNAQTNNADNTRSSYLLTYKNNVQAINYNLSINRSFIYHNKKDTTILFNLSVPFGFKSGPRPSLLAGMSYSNAESQFRTSLSGNQQLDDASMNFSTWFSQSSRVHSNFGLNVGHTGQALQKSISYSQSMNSSSLGGSLSGGLLLHSDGIQIMPWIGDTVALVQAPGAEGARLMGNKYSRIDKNGYGVMSYLTPYEENALTLNIKGAPLGFDSEDDGQIVVPTAGAVVKRTFKNKYGSSRAVIARIKDNKGSWLPFGTPIYNGTNSVLGTVGQGGILLISLPENYQPLEARWSKNNQKQSCLIQPWATGQLNTSGSELSSSITLRCRLNGIKD